ncbi:MULTISPECIES: monovalent cation/H(+) antiporter subunit G [unclassified Paracoccus (in: a-proteobacteria)]|uniref:cation:proton antiporter n=1 Tax=unclassified Paracoccus (in: a-proteobacteria) TaxID=2688777 RepID=UPI000719328C|nr:MULTISPECIES: monovalent cation/H(+) antiporter subunit G [unclassified Paracoccus (in: a-proteobacteria)]KRW94394.1 cation:proton antiporter [Paracoccus sp. MKU1]MDF3907508.1 monovalent cation/H(+) antiporter subunit G [Paracoccus sp. AS002]
MNLAEAFTILFVVAGIFFFVAGTVGLLRFPDTHTRLHALTKADNLGLGLIAFGLAFRMPDVWGVAKLGLVWLLAVLAAATVAQLVARAALDRLPDLDEKGGAR